jgi:ribosome-binding factor A
MTHTTRRYERTARVNEVVREVLADELERLWDPHLGFLTVTSVEVTPDLRQATVWYSVLKPKKDPEADQEDATAEALKTATPHLQSAIGRQVRMKYTPRLVFREDPAIRTGERVDEILRQLRSEDE